MPDDVRTTPLKLTPDAEKLRLEEDARRGANWKRWGPYLSERQWGTVREDYSPDGNAWEYFPHDHARSRAYRWGEDGLMGFCDRECRLCFAVALWNGHDPILKERLYGLTGHEGNHGEDVKEAYFYVDATPTYSYAKTLYKYPQASFPYEWLQTENARRGRSEPEFEIDDTGVFDENRYWDVTTEYAKAAPDDVLIRITVSNRGPEAATLHLLPTVWLRNSWAWGCSHEGCDPKGKISREVSGRAGLPQMVRVDHETLGTFRLTAEDSPDGRPDLLFTENETNTERVHGTPNASPYVKDGIHRYVVDGDTTAATRKGPGSKAAFHYVLDVPAGEERVVCLRLWDDNTWKALSSESGFGAAYRAVFARRIAEADAFYAGFPPDPAICGPENVEAAMRVLRQAYAGLLWSKQFYHISGAHWLDGDPTQPPVAPERRNGRNREWRHFFSRDILSMPDKWEYPWFAAWDTAFHMLVMARIDPDFAKAQMLLLLREWYMHPNGQIPAYEWAFGDVNPPTHVGAVYAIFKSTGGTDRLYLERAFQKLLINFTWWVNRKDADGRNLFGGGFLGMDNVTVFDRSAPLGPGEQLDQADGTAWMAYYCLNMLVIALELASEDPAYEDMASKFFEHYVAIVDAIAGTENQTGLWDDQDGFYYDQLSSGGRRFPIRLRSVVGLIPLMGVDVLDQRLIDRLPGFSKRMNWFFVHKPDLAGYTSYREKDGQKLRLLSVPSAKRLKRVLKYVLDEGEFLSPHGIRSMSRLYAEHPYQLERGSDAAAAVAEVRYTPGDSDIGIYGGNSNWRGPIWFPVNLLIIQALERYYEFYGDDLTIECPTGSGNEMTLMEVAREISRRLTTLFLPEATGSAPWHGRDSRWRDDPHWKDLVLFHEFFHGDTGQGLGASHQTGWTATIALLLEGTHFETGPGV